MLHVDAGKLRRVHAAQGLVQSSVARTRRLAPLSHGWWPCRLHWWLNVPRTYARPLLEWYFLREHDFSSHDDFERRRAWTTKRKNVKFEKRRACRAKLLMLFHARAPPICRVPLRLVFDSAILFLNSFSEKFCPISPHSLETDLYVRYYYCCWGGGGGSYSRGGVIPEGELFRKGSQFFNIIFDYWPSESQIKPLQN